MCCTGGRVKYLPRMHSQVLSLATIPDVIAGKVEPNREGVDEKKVL